MLIPIGDDNSQRQTFPFVTILIIALNGIVFFLELQNGTDFVERYSVIPVDFTHGNFPVITIFTAMFLHGGWAHLLGNMLYLYIFGDNVEDNLGHIKYLIFYLLCGIGATAAQILAAPESNIPNLGASGAIAGVLAGYIILFPRNKVRILFFYFIRSVSAWVVLGFWILTQLFAGYTDMFRHASNQQGGVAYMAHVGGFFTGVILVFLFRRRQAQAGISHHFGS